ncbi:ABC transporter substrate-binding protein [Brucella thiophenivorans]|uniref:Periplasmic binding family protein n=2 Tax=Brucella thiophenivorans TaxID=571255 RepID=A0A256G8P0_9HYPH|nr:ABC transporter substrate-binding protein [Brucella thiophenivorans]OYR23330.1 periplasmic binding family protein [Brucella thiophenivorans]
MRKYANAVLLIVGLLAATNSAAFSQEKVVKVGLITDFSGTFAQLAKDIEDGWMLALEERGGKAGDYRIQIIKEDSENSPPAGIQKANKLIKSDGVAVFGGTISSGVGVALAGIANQERVPFVAGFAVADELTTKFCSPYVARTSFSANALQSAAGAYWANSGVKTAVFMGPDYSAGHAMKDGFKRGFEGAGGEVVMEIMTPFTTTKDWGPSLLRAQQTGAEMIYSFYAGSEAVQVVKQHADFGMKEMMPLRGDMWLYDEALWAAMSGAQRDAMQITVYTNALKTPASERFKSEFKAKFGRLPVASNALGYTNAVAIFDGLADAIKANDGNLPDDGADIISAISKLKLSDDPRGPVHFNSSNNAVQDELYIIKIVEGADGLHHELVARTPYGKDLDGCKM